MDCTKVTYGLKVTITRSDMEDVELDIKMPIVSREKVEAENPALAAMFKSFDKAVEDLIS